MVGDLGIEPRRDRFVGSALALVVAVVVVVAGQVAERWCRLPEDPDDPGAPGSPGGTGGLGQRAPGSAA